MARNIRGFTLIELMIVLAIVGILASIAIPSYQSYAARAQVTEAFTITASLRTSISEFHSTRGRFPTAAEISNVYDGSLSGRYVSQVTLAEEAEITITFGNGQLNSESIVLQPHGGGSQLSGWDCSNGTVEERYLPPACLP